MTKKKEGREACHVCGSTRRGLAWSNRYVTYHYDYEDDCDVPEEHLVCAKCEYA